MTEMSVGFGGVSLGYLAQVSMGTGFSVRLVFFEALLNLSKLLLDGLGRMGWSRDI